MWRVSRCLDDRVCPIPWLSEAAILLSTFFLHQQYLHACPHIIKYQVLTRMRTATDLNDQLQPNSYHIKTAYRGDSSRNPSLLMWWRSMKIFREAHWPTPYSNQTHTRSKLSSSQNHYNLNMCILVSYSIKKQNLKPNDQKLQSNSH